MRLSIIVLTHNRLAALRECLIRLESQTETLDGEIVVVNNGSTDGTTEWLNANWRLNLPESIDRESNSDGQPQSSRSRIAIHRPTNEGVCARNHAIDLARGEFVAQVDDDVLVMAGWDRVLVEPMERDPQIGAVGQHGFYQEQSWTRTPWSAGLLDDRRRPAEGQCCDFVMGFCWAWRNVRHTGDGPTRSAFRYDERFNPFWHEESDLQLQIRAASYRILKVREVANHRSLPHVRNGAEDVAIAERNFNILKAKWQNDTRIRYEGAAVGLR